MPIYNKSFPSDVRVSSIVGLMFDAHSNCCSPVEAECLPTSVPEDTLSAAIYSHLVLKALKAAISALQGSSRRKTGALMDINDGADHYIILTCGLLTVSLLFALCHISFGIG